MMLKKATITLTEYGLTEDEAREKLLFAMHEEAQNDFDSYVDGQITITEVDSKKEGVSIE
jgi:hypothetical protein